MSSVLEALASRLSLHRSKSSRLAVLNFTGMEGGSEGAAKLISPLWTRTVPPGAASSADPRSTLSATASPFSTSTRYEPSRAGRMLPAGESIRTDPGASAIFTIALPLQSLKMVSESIATKSSLAPSESRTTRPDPKRISARESARVQMRSPGRMGTFREPETGSGSEARCRLTSPST
jgi:hypothetical protein